MSHDEWSAALRAHADTIVAELGPYAFSALTDDTEPVDVVDEIDEETHRTFIKFANGSTVELEDGDVVSYKYKAANDRRTRLHGSPPPSLRFTYDGPPDYPDTTSATDGTDAISYWYDSGTDDTTTDAVYRLKETSPYFDTNSSGLLTEQFSEAIQRAAEVRLFNRRVSRAHRSVYDKPWRDFVDVAFTKDHAALAPYAVDAFDRTEPVCTAPDVEPPAWATAERNGGDA